MGALIKLVDALLFIFFLFIAIVAPLIDSQLILPLELYPKALVDLNNWYKQEYNDYLSAEKPHFYVGLVGVQLFFQWPLALICLYGIAAGKSWLHTTCLMYGSSTFTGMVAILAEMIGSKRASETLLKLYYPFLGFAVLAILRGLVSCSGKSGMSAKRNSVNRKKRV